MNDDKKKSQEKVEEKIEEQSSYVSSDAKALDDKKASEDKEEAEKLGLQKKIEECEGKYKRALADYQNLQKRVQEEKRLLIQTANKDLLLRLLPILDTLMIAQKHTSDQGLLVSINQFLDILKAEGVIKIKTVGEIFDPQIMECVVIEEGEENKVLEELRAGYMLNGTVLRTAQVKVGSVKQT